jgi:small subunit ribosomal protein S21
MILLSAAAIRGADRRGGQWLWLLACRHQTRKTGLPVQVLVRDNNVDQALRALKKKMQREGIFREMKMRGHYEKPSEKRAREKAEAVRRARKLARKRAQREGLLPMTPRPVTAGAAAGAARPPR